MDPPTCTCDPTPESASEPDPPTIAITFSQDSIQFQQPSEGFLSAQYFTPLLTQILLEHDPSRPDDGGYTSFVHFIANDGIFPSAMATTNVQVDVVNAAPLVLLDGEVG